MTIEQRPVDLIIAKREGREHTQAELEEWIGGFLHGAVTDYQMAWTDGLAVLNEAKAQDPLRPVIMFTATATQEIAVEAMKAGLDDYVVKSPSHFVRLRAAALSALDRANVRRREADLRGAGVE